MVEESAHGAGGALRRQSTRSSRPRALRAYADDLIARMVNPFVRDTVARVGRDPRRKLGWDDRLVGAMRRARQAGVTPRRYAWGVAAALDWLATPAATMGTLRSYGE
jgi:mannitol-1-phosphate/altronate dehydrogenase